MLGLVRNRLRSVCGEWGVAEDKRDRDRKGKDFGEL